VNLKERFNQITSSLIPHVDIWENEILLQYPHSLAPYREDWLDFLDQADENLLFSLEKKDFHHLDIPKDLKKHWLEMEELTRLPEFNREITSHPFDAFAFLKIKPKKEHEIKILSKAVDQLMRENQLEQVVDIGGGIGYLAQSIANYYFYPVTSIDMDPILQNTGRQRNLKNQKKGSHLVNYLQEKLELGNEKLVPLFTPKTISLGLHTCGDLANTHLEIAIKAESGALINLGCCYYKLSKNNTYNISNFSKSNNNLRLNMYALTLATLAHKQMGHWDFQFKNMVKNYRYAFHMYLYHEKGITDFVSVGNSSQRYYEGDFASYAKEQMKRLDIENKQSDESLNHFFQDPARTRLIRKMILAGILRGIYGRPLELYLLLDRALYLEENGYKTQLIPFFDEELSPRNIGIQAIKI
jgi:SAM-dependent methyltransferase